MGIGGEAADVVVEGDLVVEVDVETLEGEDGVAGRDELLELDEVVEAEEIVGKGGLQAEAFGGLQEAGLVVEAGGGERGVELLDGRAGFVVVAADGREAAVNLAEEARLSGVPRGRVPWMPVMVSVRPKTERLDGCEVSPMP